MWPPGVAIDPPFFASAPGDSQAGEPVFVQAFIPERAVEALDDRILDRFSRFEEGVYESGGYSHILMVNI